MTVFERFVALVTCGLVLVVATPAAAQETVTYYHTDAVGSVRLTTHASGNPLDFYDYLPFGEPWDHPTTPDRRGFTGTEKDAETTLNYMRARYYASGQGRFSTVDPGHVGGNLFDPQSWNGYAYARNNPLRFIDPAGTDYFITIDDGKPFWFDGNFASLKSFASGFNLSGGLITNAQGQKVGTYTHFDRIDRTFAQAGHIAKPGVDFGVGALNLGFTMFAPGPMLALNCISYGCSASSVALSMALSPSAARKLGGVAHLAGNTIAEAIKLRGGTGATINRVATWLRNKTLGEAAEIAVRGGAQKDEAETAIKMVKQASDKAAK